MRPADCRDDFGEEVGGVSLCVVLQLTGALANIRSARTAPAMHPMIWAGMYIAVSRHDLRPGAESHRGHDGVDCAPLTGPKMRMSTGRTKTVANAFSRSCSSTLPGESCWAAMPNPITRAM